MQGTTDSHHQSADTRLPQADPVCDEATARHTTVDLLALESALMPCLSGELLPQCPFLIAGCLGRHEDVYLGQREREEAQIL
jgi:hypothetical protein